MKTQNQYDYLKTDCLDDVDPVEATELWTITESRCETITISLAPISDGAWVYGYLVYWANGGISSKQPSAENGKFRNMREAKLHAIGFMKIYLSHFLPDTQVAIRRAETDLLQGQLFD